MVGVRRGLSSCVFGIAAMLSAPAFTACKSETREDHRVEEAAAPSATQTPFTLALRRFRSEVASAYGKRAADLIITPKSEDVIGFEDEHIGDLIPFEANATHLRVRGFANDHVVVLAKRGELGPLFQAARALDAQPAMPATDLAARMVWMLSPSYQLVAGLADYPKYPLPPQITPPAFERTKEGVLLRFYYKELFGYGGAPAAPWQAEARCSLDYHAALVVSPGP